METSYITSAQQAHQLPPPEWPEVAFVGRSNCGKSSLINALLNHAGLARVSNTPGRTQMANFFELKSGDDRLTVVDLPGYGFSAIGKEVRHHWQELMEAYVVRPTVQEFFFLIDTRRAAELDEDDTKLLFHLARMQPVTVVMTKSDKATQRDIGLARHAIEKRLKEEGLRQPRIVAVSSLKKKGLEGLKESLKAHLTRSLPEP